VVVDDGANDGVVEAGSRRRSVRPRARGLPLRQCATSESLYGPQDGRSQDARASGPL